MRTLLRLGLLAALLGAVLALALRDRVVSTQPGAKAPDFALPSLEGETVRLSDLRGKVVLLNVWATWCVPCLQEMPSMQRLYERFEGRDFEIVAVSQDGTPFGAGALGTPLSASVTTETGVTTSADSAVESGAGAPTGPLSREPSSGDSVAVVDREAVRARVELYARRLRLTFPILLDPEGEVYRRYEVTGLPESFVIGRDGTIYRKVFAATEWDHEEHVALIERLLAR